MKKEAALPQDPSDQLLINKLHSLAYTPETGSWELLHAELQQRREDAILRSQLTNRQDYSAAATFENIENRIKAHQLRLRKIRTAKITEILAFWLFAWIFLHVGAKFDSPQTAQSNPFIAESDTLLPASSQTLTHVLTESQNSSPVSRAKYKSQSHKPYLQAISDDQGAADKITPKLHTVDNILDDTNISFSNHIDHLVHKQPKENPLEYSKELVSIEPIQPHIPIESLSPKTNIELHPLQSITNQVPTASTSSPWWIDLGAVMSRDLIKSPFPIQISEERLGRISGSGGLHAGVVYSTPITDFTVTLRYQFKSYGSVYGGNNEMHMISTPIQIRFKLPKMGSFQGYVTTGFLPQFAVYAHYAETALFESNPQLRYRENNVKLYNNSVFSTSAYESGIFEGESYRGNQGLSAILGIGAEYQINERLKIYLEQSYEHSLGRYAFGPGFDQFFSSSINIGVRTQWIKKQK